MKNYRKIFRIQDKRAIEALYKNVEVMQAAGQYPEEFDMPITLQYELMSECNLYCKHCYNGSGEHHTTRMTVERWKELSCHVVGHGGIFQAILSGGEPLLLGNDLFDVMDILHDDGTSFVIITNGFLLSREKVQRLKKYRYYWLQVSIDADTSELHDDFRQVKGSWEHAVHGAFEVSSAGIPLVIAHTVTPKTLERLPMMAKLAYRLGASSLMVGQVLPSGRANRYAEEIYLSPGQENRMYELIETLAQEYRGKLELQRSSGIKNQFDRYQIGPNLGCIIRPNGDVRLDCMAPFVMGNVLEEDFYDIWQRRGRRIWSDPRVQEFIASVDEEAQSGAIRNYVDADVRLDA